MSLNFQQVYAKIREIGQAAPERRKNLEEARQRAMALLNDYADQRELLREKVKRALVMDPNLRCALPLADSLKASYPATTHPSTSPILLAADGSQIPPDRHAPVLYSLVNVGAIVMESDSGKTPQVFTDSYLLYDDEVYTGNGLLTDEALALQRDLAERKRLLELARRIRKDNHSQTPLLALTDGPIELWGAKDNEEADYRHNLELHLSVLEQLREAGVIVAGYVDKPGADLLVRLLEIAALAEENLSEIRHAHPLRGVTDRWLVSSFLSPGYRSATFELQSSSRSHYSGPLALNFFYLNLGIEKHPYLVRVEIPRWVAEDREKIEILHATLLAQCRIMAARPYPYVLHRAHELAVVRMDERKQIEQMLDLELRRAGERPEGESHKQFHKGLMDKTAHRGRRG